MVELRHDDDVGAGRRTKARHLGRDRLISPPDVVTLQDARRQWRLARGIERSNQA
jgi:hypothetical protein